MDKFLRQKEVLEVVGLSRDSVFKLRKAGGFPSPVTLGKGALRWRQSEIAAWMASR